MTIKPEYTDGNALAGSLSEVFAMDVTIGIATCVGCGRQSRVAELHVYAGGPGTVARCPGCNDPVMRLARTATALVLDLRGTVSLSLPMVPAAT